MTQQSKSNIKYLQPKYPLKPIRKNGELVWTPLTEALEDISYLQRCMQMLSQESQKWQKWANLLKEEKNNVSENPKLPVE